MTETAATAEPPPTHPGPPPPAPVGLPRGRDHFFGWLRDLGVPRSAGWLGGVCAGVAARIRVDPLVVRGLFVVAALLGLPVLLVYAIAWALLPDAEERILLQSRGRFEPALLGALGMFLVGLVPVVPWAFTGLFLSGRLLFGFATAQTTIALLIIALAILVAFLLSRRRRRPRTPRGAAAQRARALSADAGFDAGAPAVSGAGAPALFRPAAEEDRETVARPDAAAENASDAELAAWRAQHADWKEQDAAWRRRQQDAERAAREQARRENQERATAYAAEAQARRRARIASRPRASAAYVAVVIGTAAITGSAIALAQTDTQSASFAPTLGLLSAALVAALGMIAAGIRRRRSGFLAFMAALLLFVGAGSAASALSPGLRLGDTYVTTIRPSEIPEKITHPWGWLTLDLSVPNELSGPIVVDKRTGQTVLIVDPGAELILYADLGPDVRVSWMKGRLEGGETVWTEGDLPPTIDDGTISGARFSGEVAPVTARHTVRLTQESGTVEIVTHEPG